MQPAEFLYQTPPIPSLPQAEVNPSLASASLDKYRHALRRQLSGRTPLLQKVLGVVEGQIKTLENELDCLEGADYCSELVLDQYLFSPSLTADFSKRYICTCRWPLRRGGKLFRRL